MDRITWSKFAIYTCEDGDLDTAPDLEFPFIRGPSSVPSTPTSTSRPRR